MAFQMDPITERVTTLLADLFQEGELVRFAQSFAGSDVRLGISKESSRFGVAGEFVHALRDRDLLDARLFDELEALRPDRSEDIRSVRAFVLEEEESPAEEASPPTRSANVEDEGAPRSAEQRAWRARLGALLDEASVPPPPLPGRLVEASSVLFTFQPAQLEPVPGPEEPPGLERAEAERRLATVCHEHVDGRWELHLPERREALGRLFEEDRVHEAVAANLDLVDTPHPSLLRRIAAEGRIPDDELRKMPLAMLQAGVELGDWLRRTKVDVFDPELAATLLERQRRIEPLRKLTGMHFRGRARALRRLDLHTRPSAPDEPILPLWGVGGVGKSALLGKFLLEYEPAPNQVPRPWVYLDFDDPQLDPRHPERLMEHVAKSLGLLYASSPEAQGFLGLESVSAGDRPFSFTLPLQGTPSLDDLARALAEQLAQLPLDEPSFVLVLDTFEQVQVRGLRMVEMVKQFLRAILDACPYARVIVSGRGAVMGLFQATDAIHLEDLDAESADAVLEALGVASHRLRQRVIESVGTNPLTLRLSAEAIATTQFGEADLDRLGAELDLVLEGRQLEITGQLYTRILGHLKDGEVRALAHPGLVVRRVTPGIIRQVLAEPCGLDPNQADVLFERLPNHVSLFEPDDEGPTEEHALRHRQDVRETMLRLMIRDPKWEARLKTIHERAAAYYEGRGDLVGRAEFLYHCLWLDAPLDRLDGIWDKDLAPSLGRCWEEPLPDRARAWLAPRLGHRHGDDESWRTADWEVSARREAEAHLETGDPEGALRVLRGRSARTPGSPLFKLEVRALRQLGRLDEATTVVRRGIESGMEAKDAKEVLGLRILAAEVALARGDLVAVRFQSKEAARLAAALSDRDGLLSAIEVLARGEQKLGTGEIDPETLAQLEQAFTAMSDQDLREHEGLSGQVIGTIGDVSMPILRKAVVAFGSRSDQQMIEPNAFILENLIERAAEEPEGRARLDEIAIRVGLPKEAYKSGDLAGKSIRFGRVGEVMATVLDQAGHSPEVRKQTLRMFNPKIVERME